MMTKKKRLLYSFFTGVSALFLLGAMCGESVPIKEMSLAKAEISRAVAVKAEKYAPQEIKEAETKLYECHTLIKDEKAEEARKSAELAFKKAHEAYEKAIPLLAKDTLEIAQKSINEAEEAYAAKLAGDDFEDAKKAYDSGIKLFENKKYYESYQKALEADKLAKNARNSALGKQDVLQEAIQEVEITLAEAKKLGADKYSPKELATAQENVDVAKEARSKLELKKGFAAVEIAKVNADEAYLEALKHTAEDNLKSAEVLYENAKKSRGAQTAKDELSASKESLSNAKMYYENGDFKKSLTSSSESKRLSAIVLGTTATTTPVKDKGIVSTGKQDSLDALPGNDEYKIYTVEYHPRRKDCLWRISGKLYKNPRLWKKIYNANRKLIKDPDLIRPGWKIRIPVIDVSAGK